MFCIALLGLLLRCTSEPTQIPASEVQRMKQQYSAEAINYLYETAFYTDGVGPKDFLSKWKDDIWIRWEGELRPRDSVYVQQVVAQLNELDLPITLRITKDTALTNLPVYFGTYYYLNEKMDLEGDTSFIGTGEAIDYGAETVFAEVGVFNNQDASNPANGPVMRHSIILEEIIQGLGLVGDSWADYNSTFFEGYNNVTHLSKVDAEVMKLLYEPCIPFRYSRKQFEQDFQDVLRHVKPTEKIIRYAKDHHTPFKHLKFIQDSCFSLNKLYKYSGRVFVSLQGEYRPRDVNFVKRAIAQFNTVSNQFTLEMAPDDAWHPFPNLEVQHHDSTLQALVSKQSISIGGMMFPRRIGATIKLSYRVDDPSLRQEDKNELLFKEMSQVLGLANVEGPIGKVDSTGQIVFDPDYKEVLALLYQPVFPSGFTQQEMDEVIMSLEQEQVQ